jgi:hypothetical protein
MYADLREKNHSEKEMEMEIDRVLLKRRMNASCVLAICVKR